MPELELSIMSRGPTTVADLQPVLDQFEAEQRVHVRVRVLNWDTAWADLLKVALYQYGPDVSEIGTTWLSSFVAMDALHAFGSSGASAAGDPSAFLASSWQSGLMAQRPGEPPLRWAIPWWADTRIIYFRRDILAQAGVELAQAAFDSPGRLAQTLGRLQASGVPIPWAVPTHQSRMTVHNVAGWVWGAGGDFVSDDGRVVLFDRPAALAGICAYLGLARFLAEPARGLDDTQSDALFHQGRAAAAISGPWLLQFASPEVVAQVGMAFPPGIPFVGGSHLVLWKHAVHDAAAVKLVRFLTSQHVQSTFGRRAGLLPTRHDVLSNPPFSDDPLYQVVAQGLEMGRSFPSVPLWGLVEEKLNEVLGHLWADLLANPSLDLEEAVAEHLEPLARRLNVTLRSRQ